MSAMIKKANAKHKETGRHYAVCELDQGEGRVIRVMPVDSTYDDEFEAFEGVVLYTTEEES